MAKSLCCRCGSRRVPGAAASPALPLLVLAVLCNHCYPASSKELVLNLCSAPAQHCLQLARSRQEGHPKQCWLLFPVMAPRMRCCFCKHFSLGLIPSLQPDSCDGSTVVAGGAHSIGREGPAEELIPHELREGQHPHAAEGIRRQISVSSWDGSSPAQPSCSPGYLRTLSDSL